MITFPNAKINLGLNIVSRRPDGYHNLETVFYPSAVTDVLEIVPSTSGETTLQCYGRTVDCPVEKNLVMRAYRLMEEHYAVPAVEMYLYKHIPDGAGLGGGSSDAAHVLTMLNAMFSLGVSEDRLAALAATLGADCPFFVYNRPMLATGIGDVLTPIDVNVQGKTLLLVKPPVGVSTKTAYSHVAPAPASSDLRTDVSLPLPMWDGVVKNDFEPSVFAAYPQLWRMKLSLLRGGAQYAAMSGSGSSIFGIFDDVKMAEALRDSFEGCDTFVTAL